MDAKETFIQIYRDNIRREGADALLDYLEHKSDFFTAPAPARYHGACAGGLCAHSVNVYQCLKAYLERERVREVYGVECSEESAAIVSLLHDVCKTGCYKKSFRNVKNDTTGQWERVPTFTFSDPLPYGHGEKSVYLIEHFMRLKTDEAIAIRWHMGGFDDAVRGGSYAVSDAYNRYPLAVKLHTADLIATYLMEQGTSSVENGH